LGDKKRGNRRSTMTSERRSNKNVRGRGNKKEGSRKKGPKKQTGKKKGEFG